MIPKPFNGRIEAADAMDATQKASFLGGCQTVVLPVGFELWRFISQKEHNRFGTFWMDGSTMTAIMQTLHANGNFTQEYKKENVRNNLAVLDNWSHLNMRVKVRLTQEVIAYVGQTGYQRQIEQQPNTMSFGGGNTVEKVTETRRGGQNQYVIPRFKGLPDNNKWARVEHCAHI